MLSLSKYERTLHLSSPYPSTSSGRTDWKGALRQAQDRRGERIEKRAFDRLKVEQSKRIFLPFMLSLPNCRHHLSPFVLSLSKYERPLQPFQSLPFDKLPSTGSGRSRANGLERRSSANFIRQAQDRQRHWKDSLRKSKEIKNSLRTLF
ncbi:MAG: hypothetical protein LBD67_04405 [Candidatus Accumulibacter sp.]|nr:hypothetical protein [Accumulibacter sp.]